MTAVVRVDPRVDPRWLDLSSGRGASLFTSPPWITAVCETYGFEPTARVVVDPAGRPQAGLAWVDVCDIRGQRRCALPFSDRADPIIDDPGSWAALASDAMAGDLPFTLRCLDSNPALTDDRFTGVGEAAWHATSLDRPLDELYGAFRSQTRRNIATAQRSGVEVVLSPDADAVVEYHRLHVELRKNKYHLLAQPREFFERIWKAFARTDDVRTALALIDGRPVAGAMYVVWQDTVYYKFGASLAEFLPRRPNDALHWALIRWAHDRGLTALDWGLSDLDQPGLVSYKSKWASEQGRIRTLNVGGPPLGRSEDVEQTLRSVSRLMTRPDVPSAVTEQAGAALYRYFC